MLLRGKFDFGWRVRRGVVNFLCMNLVNFCDGKIIGFDHFGDRIVSFYCDFFVIFFQHNGFE